MASIEKIIAEHISITDAVATQLVPTRGFVAILDALGTKLLSIGEAIRFVSLRDSIMDFTKTFSEKRLQGLDMSRLKTFIFNDTIILSCEISGEVSVNDVNNFCHVLRIAETRSIMEGFPFRGAFAIGEFFVGDHRTIMGPAISDAASWHEAADWIGIHATPHTAMAIDALLQQSTDASLDHVLVNYAVPIKGSTENREMKAINWPKGFVFPGLRPSGQGTPKGFVLSSLTKRSVPKGTESKYANTIAFFDTVYTRQRQEFDKTQQRELADAIEDKLSAPS